MPPYGQGLIGKRVGNAQRSTFIAQSDGRPASNPHSRFVIAGLVWAFAAIRYQCTAFDPSDPGKVLAYRVMRREATDHSRGFSSCC